MSHFEGETWSFLPSELDIPCWILEILVPQFASCVRVFPHLKLVASQVSYVQVWLMYSDAIQMESPSTTAAP